MTVLNQVDYFEPTAARISQDPHESVLMECGRLVHAAVINRRFLEKLLANPLKTIEDGYCGEKFSFTREEQQQIMLIQASSLAEFSQMLVQAVQLACCIPPAPEMAYARLQTRQ